VIATVDVGTTTPVDVVAPLLDDAASFATTDEAGKSGPGMTKKGGHAKIGDPDNADDVASESLSFEAIDSEEDSDRLEAGLELAELVSTPWADTTGSEVVEEVGGMDGKDEDEGARRMSYRSSISITSLSLRKSSRPNKEMIRCAIAFN
jgi:hypothetical protein